MLFCICHNGRWEELQWWSLWSYKGLECYKFRLRAVCRVPASQRSVHLRPIGVVSDRRFTAAYHSLVSIAVVGLRGWARLRCLFFGYLAWGFALEANVSKWQSCTELHLGLRALAKLAAHGAYFLLSQLRKSPRRQTELRNSQVPLSSGQDGRHLVTLWSKANHSGYIKGT